MFLLINFYTIISGNVSIARHRGRLEEVLVPNVRVLATTSLLNALLVRAQAPPKDSLQRDVTLILANKINYSIIVIPCANVC
jgi:hypothetical protein